MSNKKISQILFYIFIFFLPWQTRLILTPEKPEFLSFSIYLSEIFLWLALAFWLANTDLKKIKPPIVILLYCYIVLLSILWAGDKMAAFRIWLYIFDGIMIYLFLREHKDAQCIAAKIFLISLFFSACLGIWQFFNLGSPAFKWLGLAERGAWNLGDIVVESGGRFLRAYGSMPHPNILGGYLAAGILLLLIIFPERSEAKSRGYIKNFILRHAQEIKFLFIGIFFLALFLTFSRSAWISLSIALFYLFFIFLKNRYIITHTIVAVMIYRFFQYFIFLFSLAIIFSIIFWPLLKTRTTSSGRLEQKSNTERVTSWKDGLGVWLKNPILGVGAGNNTTINYQLPTTNYKQVQPPHNIFILILSELGLAGFLIYLFIWKKFWKNPAVRPFLILFFIIGLFDHYLWTLYSGQLLFWLALGLTNEN